MKYIELAVDWVLNSSADPTKLSLSVRSALVFALGVAVKASATACAVGLSCVTIDQGLLGQAIDAAVNIVFWGCSIVGAVGFVAGVVRKVWRTATGNLAG